MTTEIRSTITALMNEEFGAPWWAQLITEEMCDKVCARCPYRETCSTSLLCYSCPVWEERMGEDL